MTYEPLVEKSVKFWNEHIDSIKKMNGHARIVRMIEEQFPDVYYHSDCSSSLWLSLKVKDAGQILKVLRWLRGYGYKSISFDDDPSIQSRSYRIREMTRPASSKYDYDFRMVCYFSGEDSTCKFVEVGKKKQEAIPAREVPILELRCGDEAVPVEA